jgi:hypothetical protein
MKHIAPERLLGFVQTPWRPTIPEFRERLIQAAEQVGQVIAEQSATKKKASALTLSRLTTTRGQDGNGLERRHHLALQH